MRKPYDASGSRLDSAPGYHRPVTTAEGTLTPSQPDDGGQGPDRAPDALVEELDGAEATLAAVEAALARLDEGAYGRCTSCGGPVEASVLEDDPAASHCQACAHDQAPRPGGDTPSPPA